MQPTTDVRAPPMAVHWLHDGSEHSAGPFTLSAAETIVVRLAREHPGRDRFYAFVCLARRATNDLGADPGIDARLLQGGLG
jgi:hypothetical protein